MNKCLVICVEGDTEVAFYKKLIKKARPKCPDGRFACQIKYINAEGVGEFKKTVLRKFIKEIKQPYTKKYGGDCSFVIALCRDTDVNEFSPKPPINWKNVERDFMEEGVQKVIHIEAKHSIEDWFMLDLDGVISFLRLPKKTKVSGKTGLEKIRKLYKQAKKVYYKGQKSDGLIEKLDMDKIVEQVHAEVEPLFQELGIRL